MTDFRLGSLVAEVAGEGPAVVMVHGLGGSSNTFQPLMPALGDRRVIRPDLPGAGRSALKPGTPGLTGLCQALRDLLRACGVTAAHLVGHSMGTLICQYLAAAEPKLVSGLTLYGPILEPPEAARSGLKERAAAARRDGMAGIADAVSRASLSAATQRNNPAAVAFVRESLLRQDPAGYAAHCEALAEAKPADHTAIACPTLLATGAEDPVAPPEMARRLGSLLGRARVEVLPDCGHWMTMEAPAAALRLLDGCLKETTQ
ncbi:alpha/beta fold hydrolase [Pelagibius sp. 7325]|uniref:alpha/beta fold hydrolase n=1 Tax=Pelagibius sp. 7325 TaxID=3131994 RepID=UPI0030ED18A5